MNNMTVQLITFGALLLAFISLLNLWYKFKNIKVIKNNKDLTAEEMQVKIEQLKIVQKVSKLTENKVARLIKLSGNPLHLNAAAFSAVVYILPIILFFIGWLFYINRQPSMTYFFVMVGVICFWYPVYHYKEQIKARENAWYKVQQYIFKIEEELASNDYKKALINVAVHLKNVGEDEMYAGFQRMVELWPKESSGTMQAIEEFKDMYPFEIATDLYSLLLAAEDSQVDPTNRLEAFKRVTIAKYDKFANKVLNSIPATATMMSLPFLMLSAVVALLLPAVYKLMMMF